MHYEVLPNGTEMLITEDHRVPCAALQVLGAGWFTLRAERSARHGTLYRTHAVQRHKNQQGRGVVEKGRGLGWQHQCLHRLRIAPSII